MFYIATFYSHFGSIRFDRICKKQNIPSRIMPVPRNLSSSCGTCVRYESGDDYSDGLPESICTEELEQLVREADGGKSYDTVYRAENS